MHASIDLSRVAKHLLATGGYTTKSLGEAVGLSQPSMSRIASGKTRDVSADVALRLIRLAGGLVELPDLATTEGAPPVPTTTEEVRDAA